MIIERQLENDFVSQFTTILDRDDVQFVSSRDVVTKTEEKNKSTIVAIAAGFRTNDSFSLSPITVPVSISITTRVELDPLSEKHDEIVEQIVDVLSRWHVFGDEMERVFTNNKFFAGELRLDGGTPRTFDNTNNIWTETISLAIRGAEKFNN